MLRTAAGIQQISQQPVYESQSAAALSSARPVASTADTSQHCDTSRTAGASHPRALTKKQDEGNEARWLRDMGYCEGAGMTTQNEFKRDEVLFHQGNAANCVLRIVAGEVEVLREMDGATVLLGHARAGDGLVKWRRSKPAATAPQHEPSRMARLRC
jgi:hypothetical protein